MIDYKHLSRHNKPRQKTPLLNELLDSLVITLSIIFVSWALGAIALGWLTGIG